tara:strand:+ start:11254 stop:12102 length:849 start_codon:yes stop_codon:yes gene_type:complete
MSAPKLGIIGFGEVGAILADALSQAGIDDITAFVRTPRTAPGITTYTDAKDALAGRDIVLLTVTAAVALDVAKAIAPLLTPGQIVIDLNSVSPVTKREIADIINATEARFVEAAIMGAVPNYGLKVPILMCGDAAGEAADALNPYGMDLTDIGPEYGRASAIKMFRSIVIKGFEALLQECVLGADKYGAADEVLESISDGYPGLDWKHFANYLIGRTAIHGSRRAAEMDEVAATLRDVGVDPIMSEAAAKRIRSLATPAMKEAFGNTAPESFHDVLDVMKKN